MPVAKLTKLVERKANNSTPRYSYQRDGLWFKPAYTPRKRIQLGQSAGRHIGSPKVNPNNYGKPHQNPYMVTLCTKEDLM